MQDCVAPKALLFDWDDTITRNWWRVFQSMNKTLVYMGHTEWDENKALRTLGASGRDIFPKLFSNRWEEASVAYYTFLDETLDNAPEPLPGAIDSIRSLSSKTNLYMGVLSNKRGPYLRSEVSKLGLDDCFEQIVGCGDATVDKPGRAAVEMALSGSGLEPGRDVWFIGDSHTDMQCAHDNGCTAILIETKTPPEDMLADILPHLRFKDCTELTKYIFDRFSIEINLLLSQTQCK